MFNFTLSNIQIRKYALSQITNLKIITRKLLFNSECFNSFINIMNQETVAERRGGLVVNVTSTLP